MAETAGSRMIPTFFAACICPWQYFGMKIRKRKRALGHQAGALFAGQIFLRLWSPGGRDWAHERKYPLLPIARRQCMGFLVIFGQAERKKFEEIRESLPPAVCRQYDEAKPYRGGKWALFSPTDATELAAAESKAAAPIARGGIVRFAERSAQEKAPRPVLDRARRFARGSPLLCGQGRVLPAAR